MTKRLLLSDVVYDFVGRLEHFEEDWNALIRALISRGRKPLGPIFTVGGATAPPANKTRVDEYLLLEPPVPAAASAADVRNLCRMVEPDLACLAGVYVAPSLCRRPLAPADWGNASGAGTVWDLWIKNK